MSQQIVLEKMRTLRIAPVEYFLPKKEDSIALNTFIGKEISLHHTGNIFCGICEKKTYKSFGEGLCYSCFMNAPENAECILRPELCQAHEGIGRDVEWEKRNHLQPHFVYLALVNEVKVGVTRETQIPTRWIDQGANQALIIAETPYRQLAGRIEVALKEFFTDKTNWQRMLKNDFVPTDLVAKKGEIKDMLPAELAAYINPSDEVLTIEYPVLSYPEKVKSIGFDKAQTISGKLMGIRGQYLLFEGGMVLNIRKHSGYEVIFE